MSLLERLDNLFGGAELLLDVGLEVERIREVIGPDGIDYDRLTNEELEAIVASGGEFIGDTGVRWDDATDEELQQVADGADPSTVFSPGVD